jgi:hypothetical protein
VSDAPKIDLDALTAAAMQAEVVVDVRQESKTPVEPDPEPWIAAGVSEKGWREREELHASVARFFVEPNWRAYGEQHRDEVCELLSWKIGTAVAGGWTANSESQYQAKLLKHRDWWKKFVTPDADASAEWIDAKLKYLWVAGSGKPGRTWPQSMLLAAVKELGI